jgi:ribosomal protein S18 acetylase RimI-like enzyme
MSAPAFIRTMRASDLHATGGWAEAEGWTSETVEEFEAFLDYDPGGCLIAESDGVPVAICVATRYGDKGFIGEMIVSREARGLGLGPPLFDRALRYLLEVGCLSVSLDAVPKAAAFYETRGFRTISLSRRLLGRVQASLDSGVRPMECADLARVLTIDRVAFGADRSFFLRRRLDKNPELAWIRTDGSRITGYVFGRRRRSFAWAGPMWVPEQADEPAAILRGFAEGAGDTDIQAGVLDIHDRAISLFRSLGFAEKLHPSRRMNLGQGEPVGLHAALLSIGTAAKG